MKHLKVSLIFVLFLTIIVLGTQVIANSRKNQKIKKEIAELQHFTYGLFSVDKWKEQITVIIVKEIDRFSLSRGNQKQLKSHLERQLHILIDKIDEKMTRDNAKTTEGRLKQTLIDGFVDIKDIKEGIPQYADAILKELSSPRLEAEIKSMIKDKINDYLKKTYDVKKPSLKERIIASYKLADEEIAIQKLKHKNARLNAIISEHSLLIIVLALIIFVIEGFTRGALSPTNYFLLTFTLMSLLLVGVTTPMIDMEAKISHLSFRLFDHPVTFNDQVLYFQSKSVMDVFWIMIKHKDLEMKLVGVLMVAFSVVFPVLKMLSSLAYYFDYCQARKYRLIQFFVLKSGKWSMADVLVVAIFMAFIGFNGIINSQLGDLKPPGEAMELLTTNRTNLQPGFYIFLAYTILAMFLSGFLKSRPYDCLDN